METTHRVARPTVVLTEMDQKPISSVLAEWNQSCAAIQAVLGKALSLKLDVAPDAVEPALLFRAGTRPLPPHASEIGPRPGVGQFLWIDPDCSKWHRVTALEQSARSILVTVTETLPPYGMTKRELEVLHLVTDGASNADIAYSLWVSIRTVSTHIEHLLKKLGVRSRTRLATKAIREGLQLLESPGSPNNASLSAKGSQRSMTMTH